MGAQSDLGLVVVGLVINVADQELDWAAADRPDQYPKVRTNF